MESLTVTATTLRISLKTSHYFSTFKKWSINSHFNSKFRFKMDSSFFWCHLEKTTQSNTFFPLNVFFLVLLWGTDEGSAQICSDLLWLLFTHHGGHLHTALWSRCGALMSQRSRSVKNTPSQVWNKAADETLFSLEAESCGCHSR